MIDAGNEGDDADGGKGAGTGGAGDGAPACPYDADELAGVVDLFGGLSPAELRTAVSELAFREGREDDDGAVESAIGDATASYHLLAVERDGERLLVPGPVAFPTLPEQADDLPHILDVSSRTVATDALTARVRERLRADAERAVEEGNAARAAELHDVTYDAEAWVAVNLDDVRGTLAPALDDADDA